MHWHEFPWKLDRIDCEKQDIYNICKRDPATSLYNDKKKYVYSHFLSYTTW